MDIDHRAANIREKIGAEDLHISGEHNEVAAHLLHFGEHCFFVGFAAGELLFIDADMRNALFCSVSEHVCFRFVGEQQRNLDVRQRAGFNIFNDCLKIRSATGCEYDYLHFDPSLLT